MFTRRSFFLQFCLVLTTITLAACQHGEPRTNSDTPRGKEGTKAKEERAPRLGSGDIYVVGRIEIVPTLKAGEQELKTLTSERLRNRVYVFYSNQFVDLDNLGMGSGKHAELVDIGKHFVIKRKNPGTLHYTGGMVWLRSSATHSGGYYNRQTTIHTGHLFLSSKMTYALRPGDKAVYVGTHRYYRDDYNAITKVEYRDEYAQALKEFRRAVQDPSITLRKVIPQKAK